MEVSIESQVKEQQSSIPSRVRVSSVQAAWWLATGEADPTLASRFMYGTPDEAKRREQIAAQLARLFSAAEAAGIGDTLTVILDGLFRQTSSGPAPS
jgi:flagellar basal body L-ring protein FlgH